MLIEIKKKKNGKEKRKIKREILYSISDILSKNKINGNGNCVQETF